MSSKTVECSIHGDRSPTFVCHHLLRGEGVGFNVGYDPDEPDALYPDAWCDACEEVVEKEGEWNDRSEAFADIRLLCSGCYCETRERNWKEDEQAVIDLITQSFEYLQSVQESFKKEFRLDDYERWDWSQDDCKLLFSNGDQAVVECDIDFVGSFSHAGNSWMWVWANESFPEAIKSKSRLIRDIGEDQNMLKLASAVWHGDQIDAWEMTAVMAAHLKAIGAYRTASDMGYVYMVIKNARWVENQQNNR